MAPTESTDISVSEQLTLLNKGNEGLPELKSLGDSISSSESGSVRMMSGSNEDASLASGEDLGSYLEESSRSLELERALALESCLSPLMASSAKLVTTTDMERRSRRRSSKDEDSRGEEEVDDATCGSGRLSLDQFLRMNSVACDDESDSDDANSVDAVIECNDSMEDLKNHNHKQAGFVLNENLPDHEKFFLEAKERARKRRTVANRAA
mmetsp:Transcript_6222/g.9464  ORF Transcript_6222/g.9464 Transcript_6222/m.9464 type:complete len:210 (+) Transcript_6222:112-741(+)|eukprot:CAMPEP_0118698138 /NCGR_PEP_ID=MMETSP0800-20121206/15009_1 /TAXON_ID=210618 ORGANISM="Striatella unipunctata, Strain CCMP2910" /NCGR_SAMPLE_ID=MMETSP0800 /ASSEMBLY_ACC=CAM_ASM_000638 /LENGTH=209 /DNA_ID=CAMNT_0006597875 /DNA_START=102 /DNA_END=731 /DNA_ORIENTATION=-